MHPRCVMERIPDQIKCQIVSSADQSPFFVPFIQLLNSPPKGSTPASAQLLASDASSAIMEGVVPAYARLLRFFLNEYLPACPKEVGIWQFANGKALYEHLTQKFTTTSLTPQEIHDLGLAQVEEIRREMLKVVHDLKFAGNLKEFMNHLRTAPQFYATSPAELEQAYRAFCKKVNSKMDKIVHKMPKVGYEIEVMPANLAPDMSTGNYVRPSTDGKRPGIYFINLYRPETRPLFEIPALSLHEAVPGHHLQIAAAMELSDLPNFRRFASDVTNVAFVEGWGLYAESLGHELGCYDNPYDKFGQLSYSMWRATRLVVDTGIHAFRWPREKAVQYMLDNCAKSEHDIRTEVDRYIYWPGQALAYKIGELEIWRLRKNAERKLGSKFDLRDFHEVVLGAGSLPIDLLEKNVKGWLEAGGGKAAHRSNGTGLTL